MLCFSDFTMKDLQQCLLFLAGAIGLVIYLCMIKEKKYWDKFEMLMSGLYVFVIPLANSVLEASVIGDSDTLSLYVFRLGLLSNVAVGFGVFLTLDSRDPVVHSSILISSILSRGMNMMCSVYSCLFAKALPKEMMCFDLWFLGLLVVGNFAHLRKVSRKDGSMNVGSHVSINLTLDALATFLLGVALLGFPTMVLDKIVPGQAIGNVHNMVATSFGGLLIGGSVLSFASLCFKNEEDAVAILKSKFVIYYPALLMAMYNHYIGTFSGTGHVLMIGVLAVLALNVLAAWASMAFAKSKKD